jgi:hypothetical protein
LGDVVNCNPRLSYNQRTWLKTRINITSEEGNKAVHLDKELEELYMASNGGNFEIRTQITGNGAKTL